MNVLRRFIDIVDKETLYEEDQLDKVSFFRSLNNMALGLRNPSPTQKNQAVDGMFALVAQGKQAAANMPADEKAAFLQKMQQYSHVSSTTLGLGPRGAAPTDDHTPTRQGPGVAIRGDNSDNFAQQAYHGGDTRGPPWRMIKLAYKAGPERKALGISVQGQKYFIFHGTIGQKYDVIPTSLEAAQAAFSKGLDRGYTEVSPGGYKEITK